MIANGKDSRRRRQEEPRQGHSTALRQPLTDPTQRWKEEDFAVKKAQLLTIYLGGFVGPFSGQSISVILPNVADTFGISLEQSALTMAAYLFPFATVMLISTHMVRQFRPLHVICSAYVVTLIGAILCLFAPNWWMFLAGFAIMGISNAFTTPVFQVMLGQIVPPSELGAALGTYAAMQSLGLFSAPLISGLATLWHWQTLYLVVAAAAAWILLIRVPDVEPPATIKPTTPGRIPWGATIIHMYTCLMIGFGVIGVAVLASLSVGDRFNVGAVGRGAVIMCGGMVAFIFSRAVGRSADRIGAKQVLLASTAIAALAVGLVPIVPAPWIVAICWAAAILAVQGIQVPINLAVLASPGGPSLIATVQAFRFYGGAITPALMTPLYLNAPLAAFWIPAGFLITALLMQMRNPVWARI